MTNGEKIKEIFPNIEITEITNNLVKYVRVEVNDKNSKKVPSWVADIDTNWWNAEYKNGEKHIEKLLSWYKEAVTEDGVCYLTSDDKNTLAYAIKCCKQYEDMKKDFDSWVLREEPSSSENPNKSETSTGSTIKNDLSVEELTNKLLKAMDFAIKATDLKTAYGAGVRSGIGYCKSLIFEYVPENNVGNIEPITKNDLAVDCIDRQATLDAIIKRLGIRNETYLLEAERVIYQQILAMPSVTPLSSGLEKNSKKLEKDFGESDCISRQAVLELIADYDLSMGQVVRGIHALPSVTPQEPLLEKINKMKSEIADSLEFWDYSPNNNPLARDMLETITNFWGDMKGEEE